MRSLNGGWTYTWQGNMTNELAQQYNTILEAVTNKFGKDNITYVQGVAYKEKGQYYEDTVMGIDAAVQAAANADYVCFALVKIVTQKRREI